MGKVRLIVAGLAAGAMLAVPGLASASPLTWRVQSTPSPTSYSEFNAVACPSATECVAVGEAPLSTTKPEPLAETWNGKAWRVDRLPLPKGVNSTGIVTLTGVSCASPRMCLAVGEYLGAAQYAFSELWSDGHWTEHNGADISVDSANFNSVSCPSTTACVTVGTYVQGGAGGPLSEEWQGSRWVLIKSAAVNSVNAQFDGVSCSSAGRCTAVGYRQPPSGPDVPLVERLRRGTWVVESAPAAPGRESADLASVSCPTTSVCVAVGDKFSTVSTTFAEAWNGEVWRLLTTPRLSGQGEAQLNGVSCTTASACRAVGFRGGDGRDSASLAEGWNGHTWTSESVSNPSKSTDLLGVACTSGPLCTAAGSEAGSSSVRTLAERN